MHYNPSCNTQSSAPEDGQNNCPKHVELIGIINKPLLLHLVGVCIIASVMHGHTSKELRRFQGISRALLSAPPRAPKEVRAIAGPES